jgi:hypothetical protein
MSFFWTSTYDGGGLFEEEGEFYRAYYLYGGSSNLLCSVSRHRKPSVGASFIPSGIVSAEVDLNLFHWCLTLGFTLAFPHYIMEWPDDIYWPRRLGWSAWFDHVRFSLWERMGWRKDDPWWERSFLWPREED